MDGGIYQWGDDPIKYSAKIPKFNEQTHIELLNDGWKPLKEPKKLSTAMLLSVPFMFINALISIGVIYFFSSFSVKEFAFISGNSFVITLDLGVIFAILLLIIIHELFHLIFIPNFLRSKDTFIGLTFFGGYVHTEQTLSKARFLLISIGPFFILSILLPIILGNLGILSGTLVVFIILNSMSSSVDLLGGVLVLMQVPKNGVLRNNGTRTYWKLGK